MKYLYKLNRISAWILLVIMILYIISGYGMTKQIIDPVFARYLHVNLLPIPLFVFLAIHLIIPFRKWLKKLRQYFS